MNAIYVLSLFSLGCGNAGAQQQALVGEVEQDGFVGRTPLDLQQTIAATEIVLDRVREMRPAHRKQAAESLRILTVNCPYTRASVQLPLAVHRVVMGIDPKYIDTAVRSDWVELQRGLTAHVAILDALQVDLPEPEMGDFLFSESDTPAIITRAALLENPQPLESAWPLLHANRRLTEGFDARSLDEIERQVDLLRADDLDPRMRDQNRGWLEALERLEPVLTDWGTRATVRELIDLLEMHAGQGC